MKKIILLTMLVSSVMSKQAFTQESALPEKFGNTLNIGAGIGYYGYARGFMPVLHANYEFDVLNNFTLAPFITVYSYRNYHYWGNQNYPHQNYYYRQTVIPIGVKGTYYLDNLFGLNSHWDLYLAGSVGFAIRKTTWENGYTGQVSVSHGSSGLYLDGHLGAEYHINSKLGLFLDFSTGISTLGLAFHM